MSGVPGAAPERRALCGWTVSTHLSPRRLESLVFDVGGPTDVEAGALVDRGPGDCWPRRGRLVAGVELHEGARWGKSTRGRPPGHSPRRYHTRVPAAIVPSPVGWEDGLHEPRSPGGHQARLRQRLGHDGRVW